MREPMRSLVELQRLDTEMQRLEELQKASAASLLKEERGVAGASASLAETEQQVKQLQMVVDKHNVELATLEEAVLKLEGQKMTLKTNEDYAAMQKQIDGRRTEIGELEEKILEAMEVVDLGKTELPPRQEELKAREEALERGRQRVAEERQSLQAQRDELQKQWDVIAQRMARAVLERYVAIRDRRHGHGIALLSHDNKCQECFMSTNAQVMISVMKGDLIECPSCARLLYSASVET